MPLQPPPGVQILSPITAEIEQVLHHDALSLVATLQRTFNPRRKELLKRRSQRQAEIDAGVLPDFLAETAEVRTSAWQVAPAPADLNDRRVEITGPTERKMMINALNSGAKVFMADFEDALSPTSSNLIQGQLHPAHDRISQPGWASLLPQRGDGHVVDPPPRLASVGKTCHGRRRVCLGQSV